MNISVLAMVSLIGFGALSLYAAAFDLRNKSIPNALVFTLLGGFLVLAAGSGWSREEIAGAMIASAIVLFFGLLVFSLGWSGAGDGKFAAVCALWIGSGNVLNFLFYTTLFGAVFALITMIRNRDHWSGLLAGMPSLNQAKVGVPYGAAIAMGAFAALPSSPWMAV